MGSGIHHVNQIQQNGYLYGYQISRYRISDIGLLAQRGGVVAGDASLCCTIF